MSLLQVFNEIKSDLHFLSGGKGPWRTFLFDPRFLLIRNYRLLVFFRNSPFSFFNILLARQNRRAFGSQISPKALIGKNCKFPHPLGIVIGDRVVIGDGCTIYQNVALGAHGGGAEKNYPVLGNDVVIYPNSVVAGGIRIGDGAVVGACSFVNRDVEAGSVVGGVPAKVVER